MDKYELLRSGAHLHSACDEFGQNLVRQGTPLIDSTPSVIPTKSVNAKFFLLHLSVCSVDGLE